MPNERSPGLKPRWLTLAELALYTGVFVTGGIGSGKTSAIAYPALKQLLGFPRPVKVRGRDGGLRDEEWKFSGLILDEKDDFTRAAAKFAEEWHRADDLIRIAPGGKWIWNIIYNPNLATWAVAYQLGWILRNFNQGASGNDPFWENAPQELVTDYLGLLDDAEGYCTLFDYLETLINDARQNALHDRALRRFEHDAEKTAEIQRRWKAICGDAVLDGGAEHGVSVDGFAGLWACGGPLIGRLRTHRRRGRLVDPREPPVVTGGKTPHLPRPETWAPLRADTTCGDDPGARSSHARPQEISRRSMPSTDFALMSVDDLREIPVVLTSKEAARVLRVGVREVRLLVDTGQLAGARVGPRKVIRIARVALLALLKVREAP